MEGRRSRPRDPDVQQHKGRFSVEHPEGADVGYRWFERPGTAARSPFGSGSATRASPIPGLEGRRGKRTASRASRSPTRALGAGIETAQVYARVKGVQRLIGWARVALKPGEEQAGCRSRPIRRLLASYDVGLPGWRIDAGRGGLGRHGCGVGDADGDGGAGGGDAEAVATSSSSPPPRGEGRVRGTVPTARPVRLALSGPSP